MGAHVAQSTQEQNPRKAVNRTALAVVVAAFPVLNATLFVIQAELSPYIEHLPGWIFAFLNIGIATTAVVTMIFTRIMALPVVNDFLRRFFPALAPDAAPPASPELNG